MKRILLAAGVTVAVLVAVAGPAAATPLDDPSSPVHWDGNHESHESEAERREAGNDRDGDGHPDAVVADTCVSHHDGGAVTGPALSDACVNGRADNPMAASPGDGDVADRADRAQACAVNGADEVCGWYVDDGSVEISAMGSPGVCAQYSSYDGQEYPACANGRNCVVVSPAAGLCY